jgi:chromosome segregation ATPase
MSSPFSLFQRAQLEIIKGRISLSQNHSASLSQSLEQEISNQSNVETLSADATSQKDQLQQQVSSKMKTIRDKDRELQDLGTKKSNLNREYNLALGRSYSAKDRFKDFSSRVSAARRRLESIKGKLQNINKEIVYADKILNRPEPLPRYDSTPGTCIHGHVNCPNLPIVNPGHTTLLNQAEISAYKQEVADARHRKIRLLDQKSQLMEEEGQLETEYNDLQLKASTAQTDVWQSEAQADSKKQDLDRAQQSEEQLKSELQSLRQEANDLRFQINTLSSEISKLNGQQIVAKGKVSRLQSDQINAENEVARLQGHEQQIEEQIQAELEAMARRELEASNARYDLEEIARREIEAEHSANPQVHSKELGSPNRQSDNQDPFWNGVGSLFRGIIPNQQVHSEDLGPPNRESDNQDPHPNAFWNDVDSLFTGIILAGHARVAGPVPAAIAVSNVINVRNIMTNAFHEIEQQFQQIAPKHDQE